MTLIRNYWWLLLAGLIVLALITASVLRGDETPPTTTTVTLVCVDSTVSTDPVRADYLPDLQALGRKVSKQGGSIVATRCGPHTTGTADWTVKKSFAVGPGIGPDLAEKIRSEKADELKAEFKELVKSVNKKGGSPLGQMLSVTARKCLRVGPPCDVYLFTDGEWIDKRIDVRDGVSDAEQKQYVEYYGPGLRGLRDVPVSFIGVGRGTKLDEAELADAERVAEALVEEGGGSVAVWG